LREECRLRVFENRVLRRIFVPKRDEVTGEWRRLHKMELYAPYSPNINRVIKSRRLRWAGHVVRMGDSRCVVKVKLSRCRPEQVHGRSGRLRPRIFLTFGTRRW
jgi:hypothetical protein